MASVTSLDADMRNLRMSRYTPAAANEVRTWMETSLGTPLASGDLLDALKDGIALCKLANLVLPPPGIKFKTMSMPFIQMENISHFLKACEMPPLNMPAHDRFLTVDLYEGKDPAQVLQCLSAFSRRCNAVDPARFPSTIGPAKSGAGPLSPSSTGAASNGAGWRQSNSFRSPAALPTSSTRPMTPSITGGSTGSQQTEGGGAKSPGPVSSWSKRGDESTSMPAWNIHQYGYMGGASQGNQGVSFGARRQITSAGPAVPNAAEKLKKRREKEEEELRAREQAEAEEVRAREAREAEEERERVAEEQRWEAETRRVRDDERRVLDEQKRQWELQEERWREEEAVRRAEDAEMQATMAKSGLKKPPERPRVPSSSILKGQSLSQWQKEQAGLAETKGAEGETPEQRRVKELEKQLEEARERERQYQAEREERLRSGNDRSRPSTAENARPESAKESEKSWAGDEREYLRQQWQQNSQTNGSSKPSAATPGAPSLPTRTEEPAAPQPPARLQPTVTSPSEEPPIEQREPSPEPQPSLPSSPLPQPPSQPQHLQPSDSTPSFASAPHSSPLGSPNRPLPTPETERTYSPWTPSPRPQAFNRVESHLASSPAPPPTMPRISSSREAGDTAAEQSADRDRRMASQQKTKAGASASKSLLEREMERERERQKEWEARQEESKSYKRDANEGPGEGQSWDVNQYGYTGGDGQGRKGVGSSAGSGIDFGGRRQILGPRAMGPR